MLHRFGEINVQAMELKGLTDDDLRICHAYDMEKICKRYCLRRQRVCVCVCVCAWELHLKEGLVVVIVVVVSDIRARVSMVDMSRHSSFIRIGIA